MKETNESDPENPSSPSLINRFLAIMPLLSILIVLGFWSVGFYLLQESQSLELADDLLCLTFFGGLLFAITLGGLVGSLLRRLISKRLMRGNGLPRK